ncbi:MAG: T9SS type A sorting domain-containing protein [Flavobacteriales bacterium]|jgi:hypothetical protein|nr:T9SS type A sorting domain-containing protein [Flavobacteriales bacterium]MBT3964475.1 T9SS type A sorting domain-containing protein [Flavobacteriales bacterium]MBT4704935.1 T9SS type A sorting domain-containing protein [Flavobacteriales bacterium]MBT4929710.1 T9SS type A sorting domain-containing protein [Flavobacteriales bacterium]MBT5132848.1 T9SS type A sorting domain-containing protein [Flavobacteriales bacterium]
MKNIYTTLLFLGIVAITLAQSHVPKTPLYEVFSSSTCPPCKPANDWLVPIFEEYDGEIAVIKYQMSWPGTGDPYYSAEGNARRNFYGVNGVPAFFPNAVETFYSNFTTSSVDDDLLEASGVKMFLRYMIDEGSQSVAIKARIEFLQSYNDGGQRLFVPIIEKLTTANRKTNGEVEFHNVFKKMLPEAMGELIIATFDSGDVIDYDTTYVFQGDYRLPPNANSPIDNSTEHSVEEFDDLHVIMWMQSLVNKEVYQSAIGERVYSADNYERPWGSDLVWPTTIAEFNNLNRFVVYPNPASDLLNIEFADVVKDATINIHSTDGQLVSTMNLDEQSSKLVLDVSEYPAGIYLMNLIEGDKITSKSISVTH